MPSSEGGSMLGTRVGIGRVAALGVCLALALLLLSVAEARGAKYSVAQCGWYVDADADWADSTGGAKFRPDRWCVTPPGTDPFAGAHMKSFTKAGETVSGTRFARWRWVAPAGGAITRISGTWWHALHDGFEHRIGAGTWSGGFTPFAIAWATDVTPREFVAGFSPGVPAIEDRLVCARAESKWCSLAPGSWSGVRALTLTVEDNTVPGAGIGGELLAGGWRRGTQAAVIWGADTVSGIRYGETFIDGARAALTEYPCAMAVIGSEWRGTRMQPCGLAVSATQTIPTTAYSDGTHTVHHCVVDFSGNRGCGAHFHLRVDNNPPAHPRKLSLAGGEGWRRVNDFDFSWENPSQWPASPIAGAYWQVTGPAGYDSGVRLVTQREIAALANRTVPRAGVYRFHVWLRDEAGNSAASTAVEVPMLLDDVAPGVAFEPVPEPIGEDLPESVRADVSDEHSGPASGEIHYRRLDVDKWVELPSKLQAGKQMGSAKLVAAVPEGLPPGTYVFRASVKDKAGNETSTTRRADGTEMALRKAPPPPVAPARPAGKPEASQRTRAKTRLFAHLRWRRQRRAEVTVPFGAGAGLAGRLVNADGVGLAGRTLRVVSRPSRGAVAQRRVETTRTGEHGGFRLPLLPGPSRRITVAFRGAPGLAAARRAALALRVRGRAILHAGPPRLRTGDSLRLWGRVRARGAALPRRGKLIAIQYYESEADLWRPILLTRTDHSGRFRASYRFRYVTRTARIKLRAVVLAEERWPYVPGASQPVTVRVSGQPGQ
jgi:hypothetical protein